MGEKHGGFRRFLLSGAFMMALVACGLWADDQSEGAVMQGQLRFQPVESTHYVFAGVVGERVQRNVEQWLLPAPDANPGMLEMFRVRDRAPRPNLVPWAGEFVGKYLISAIQALRMQDDPRLQARVAGVVADLISTQAGDGYLGPFPKEERLMGHWDLWGHYHVMLALMMWHERTGDAGALDAVRRAADLICGVYLDGERRPRDAGSTEMNLSVIHVFGRLHRKTGEARYLDMMRVILEDWEAHDAGDYYRQGLAGTPFYRTPKPRWESLHGIQGLVELYRITGEDSYRTAFENLWHGIRDYDIHNTGAFSTDEQAVGSPFRAGAVETCCHVAWTYMTVDMLALTGDPAVADALELGFWNATLGYQHPSGRWSTYHTPSNGVREASAHSIVFQARHGTPELNCCSVNAPRGLGMLSDWAVMRDGRDGLVVNFYGPMEMEALLAENQRVKLRQETDYPRNGSIRMVLDLDAPTRFHLSLRIPAWSQRASVKVNGVPVDGVEPGAYLPLDRTWRDGDVVELHLDFRIRPWIGDEEREGTVSLYYGPLLLACDQKHNTFDMESMPPLNYADLAFRTGETREAPFAPLVLLVFSGAGGGDVRLCDFAHAGAHGTHYASWLPAVNLPPPAFRLSRPGEGARIPGGPNRFEWQGPAHAESKTYTLLVGETPEMTAPVHRLESLAGAQALLDAPLAPGNTYYWTVKARNAFGEVRAVNGPRSFIVDDTLENPFLANPALMRHREDGLVVGARLRGSGAPLYGVLDREAGTDPAQDRDGNAVGALRFQGRGMVRYRIPEFPHRDCTLLVWIRPEGEPAAHIRQVFSAWARAMDDPLRVFLRHGHVFAAIEGGGNAATAGTPVAFNAWTHVAVVKQGSDLALYLNGALAQRTWAPASLAATQANTVALGANPNYPGDEHFFGCLADFALYARAFDAGEIRERFTAGHNLEMDR